MKFLYETVKHSINGVQEWDAYLMPVATQASSIQGDVEYYQENNIAISQGPVTFGRDGHVSIFVRDPDRNTLELRGRVEDEEEIPGLEFYDPNG